MIDETKLPPWKQLQLHLARAGITNKDLPSILKLCPTLLATADTTGLTLEEIAAIGLTAPLLFKPKKQGIQMRPFMVEILRREAAKDGSNIYNIMEEALAIYCKDTTEEYISELFLSLAERIKGLN